MTKDTEKNLKQNIVLIRAIALIALVYLSGYSEAMAEQMVNIVLNSDNYIYELTRRVFVLFFTTAPAMFYLGYVKKDDKTVLFEVKKEDAE